VLETIALNTSFIQLTMIINSKKSHFKVKDKIDLTLGFEIDNATSVLKDKNFKKIFAEGIIQKIDKLIFGDKLIIKLNVKKAGERIFHDYLNQREMAIIKEFKQLVKNK
jgi:hypothetical protein